MHSRLNYTHLLKQYNEGASRPCINVYTKFQPRAFLWSPTASMTDYIVDVELDQGDVYPGWGYMYQTHSQLNFNDIRLWRWSNTEWQLFGKEGQYWQSQLSQAVGHQTLLQTLFQTKLCLFFRLVTSLHHDSYVCMVGHAGHFKLLFAPSIMAWKMASLNSKRFAHTKVAFISGKYNHTTNKQWGRAFLLTTLQN